MSKSLLTILGVAAVLGLWLMGQYNGLVTAKEQVDQQWAQVETQYQRRFDLIPNLVETVKGIAGQEQEVFGMIAEARTRYSSAQTVSAKAEAATEVESALGRLLVIMENYPELKSSESYQTLMSQLEGTENRVAVERGRYNEAVKAYNLKTKRFPGSLLASLFGFEPQAYFESADAAATPPAVNFGN